jgi:hypothetical protein
MFSLLNFYKSDIIILIEDDCYPEEKNWQNDWMIAAERFGHVNLFVDWIEQKFILYGEGTPQSPIKSLLTYNYCVALHEKASVMSDIWTLDLRSTARNIWSIPLGSFGQVTEGSTPGYVFI